MKFLNWTIGVVAALALSATVSERAIAQDKVSVGVFPVSSSLPYFVALERGFFPPPSSGWIYGDGMT